MSKVVSTPTATKMKVIWQNENVREFLAEFISTYVMMVSGRGGGVQGEQTLRKGSQESGASERWGSVRATHDLLPTSGSWITLSLPQPLREKHRKTRTCLSYQVFLGEKGLTICGAK